MNFNGHITKIEQYKWSCIEQMIYCPFTEGKCHHMTWKLLTTRGWVGAHFAIFFIQPHFYVKKFEQLIILLPCFSVIYNTDVDMCVKRRISKAAPSLHVQVTDMWTWRRKKHVPHWNFCAQINLTNKTLPAL